MDYNKQLGEIVNYFRNREKKIEDFKIGVEFEHFIIDRDTFKTVSYYGENGVEELLKELEKTGWVGSYEGGEYLLGLKKENRTISLEPGSQLELSINAGIGLEYIYKEYKEFLDEITPILERNNQLIITTGYHPETKIDEIKLLPKDRYNIMFDYFKDKGRNAHNMMKGTAALQVSIDYSSEEDYIKKFRVANALSPILYGLFDNAYYFEGEEWGYHNLRTNIWNNCDDNRAGTVENALRDDFNYESYGEYILNRPPIFTMRDGQTIATGEKKVKEILDPDNYTEDELEHLLTMFFPDVRTKGFIEIRQMDSIPPILSMGVVALIKGIFYSEENLDFLYNKLKDLTIEDITKAKYGIIEKGLKTKLIDMDIVEWGNLLINLAKDKLDENEMKFILPLEIMVGQEKNPYELTKARQEFGKKEALKWCVLNDMGEVF